MPVEDVLERFLANVNKEGKEQADGTRCWEWTAGHHSNGYGILQRLGETLAHRVAWRLFVGPIPAGFCVLHRCDNPPCVNAYHLFLGTQIDNIADMTAKGRANGGPRLQATCHLGHPLVESNLYYDARGKRHCRTCIRLRKRRYWQERAETRARHLAYSKEWKRRQRQQLKAIRDASSTVSLPDVRLDR